MRRILILGGTTEARELAARLAGRTDVAVTLSLAGRTANPVAQPVPVRIGGFGGAQGLARYLATERIDLLVVATHPYAAVIAGNAAQAARAAGVPLLVLTRPPWTAVAGDRWREAADAHDAIRLMGERPRHVFLALGRNDIRAFEAAPQHDYLVRSVDPITPPLSVPRVSYITARGPFAAADERALFAAHAIETIVAKNSGGDATYGKLAAARDLRIEVIMLRRPALPQVPAVATVAEALARLDHAFAPSADRAV
ncbi:MAG TPA: cobalt-precorrin-6A reductase [Xanthobacteraceae bacterium]|jgi:precorrin-6A/cobalt-precorrin-6A reductase|nr:cobalt-precorrin-6A reductase [Xanthobacteraceae bacterium]